MSSSIKEKFEKFSKEGRISLMFDLVNSFYIVKSPLQTALFLQDLLTANEIRNLSIRLRIVKLILAGKTHREIMDEIHSSLATISKVRAWLDAGGDGFKDVIGKLPLKWRIPKNVPYGPVEYHLPEILLALLQYGISKSQDKRIEKFFGKVESKESLDRSIKKFFDEFYKERALQKKTKK